MEALARQSQGFDLRKALGVAMIVSTMLATQPARGAIEGREIITTLRFPTRATPEKMSQAAEAQISQCTALGGDGLALTVQTVNSENRELINKLAGLAAKHGVKLWVAVQMPADSAAQLAQAVALMPVHGLVMLFAPPTGAVIDPAQRAALLAIKRRGDELGQVIRQVKRRLGPQKPLALCTAMSEIAPETTRSQYVPLADLVRDGTVDVVALAGAERANLNRLRLVRDAPLAAGCFLDAQSCAEKRRDEVLRRIALDVVQNDTCQLLWLADFPIETVGHVAPTIESWRIARGRRAALDAAVAKGTLIVDQEVPEKGANDVASLHGVAQGFVPSRDGACPLVQVYAAIRGSRGPLPPPIQMEVRGDENGKPGGAVLAKAEIPAAEFGAEPAFRWGTAELNPPPSLKKGQTYWIYLTNTSHPDGNYVWRMAKDAASPRGHAWSKRYDYTRHSWIFRVYLATEPSK